jgi:hypothetical protein
MTTPDSPDDLGPGEVRIYVREDEAAEVYPEVDKKRDPFEAQFRLPWKPVLKTVKITDDELEHLRALVKRIAGKLEGPEELGGTDPFAVDSVTLHVGVTATGTFVLASAGVEVAVDVTWRRRSPASPAS